MEPSALVKEYIEIQTKLRKGFKNETWKYCCYEELILENAIFMEARSLPRGMRRGIPTYCYSNSQKIAIRNPKYAYVEGLALSPNVPFPVFHAWLMDSDKRAIDVTWTDIGLCYLGIPFKRKWFQEFLTNRDREYISVIEGNYLEKFSLLKEGLSEEAIVS